MLQCKKENIKVGKRDQAIPIENNVTGMSCESSSSMNASCSRLVSARGAWLSCVMRECEPSFACEPSHTWRVSTRAQNMHEFQARLLIVSRYFSSHF